MYKTKGLKNSRIEVADALRGLAVAGIILFHSVEHFNTFARDIKYTLPCDRQVFSIPRRCSQVRCTGYLPSVCSVFS